MLAPPGEDGAGAVKTSAWRAVLSQAQHAYWERGVPAGVQAGVEQAGDASRVAGAAVASAAVDGAAVDGAAMSARPLCSSSSTSSSSSSSSSSSNGGGAAKPGEAKAGPRRVARALAIHVRLGDALSHPVEYTRQRALDSLANLPRSLTFAALVASALHERGGRLTVLVALDVPPDALEANFSALLSGLPPQYMPTTLRRRATSDGTPLLTAVYARAATADARASAPGGMEGRARAGVPGGVPLTLLPAGNPLVALHCLAAADVLLPTRSHFSASAAMLHRGPKVLWAPKGGYYSKEHLPAEVRNAQQQLGQRYFLVPPGAEAATARVVKQVVQHLLQQPG